MSDDTRAPPDLAAIWREFAGAPGARRPDFRFDPDFYGHRYADVAGEPDPAARARHFADVGEAEGRNPTLYRETAGDFPHLDEVVAYLVRDPRLKAAIAGGVPGAAELTFELMALGDPVDRQVADFSVQHYRTVSPDLATAPDIALFLHYVKFGHREGRPVLARLRRNVTEGARAFDPARRTVIVATHEFSATGAPMVALDLARRAADTFNVVVLGLRRASGELVERFAEVAVAVAVTERPFEEWAYLDPGPLDHADFAVLNSVECFPLVKALVAREVPFVSYVHEFTNYTLPAYKCVVTALYAERVLFSSETVRRSWAGVLADAGFDIDRDSAIVPQDVLVPAAVPEDEYRAARSRLEGLIGTAIGDRRVVYGAGQVHWRKGTDIFAMLAAGARRTDPDTIFVWIGDGLDHEDFHVGVWVEKHLADGGVNDPAGNLFFLPAGPYYRDVCRAADVLFLSSRLDPLPNVVFDAARFGCGVVLFAGASGFDDARYLAEPIMWRVPFGDLAAAAGTIAAIPVKTLKDGAFAVRPDAAPEGTAGAASGDMSGTPSGRAAGAAPEAAAVFDRIVGDLGARLAASAPPAGDGAYDVGILYGPSDPPGLRARERRTVWRHGRRAVWQSRAEAEGAVAASGNWVHRTLRIAPYREMLPAGLPPYRIHVHAYYTDAFAGDLSRHAAYRHAERVVATTDTEEKADGLEAAGRAAGVAVEARLVPNRGRDVLPFLALFDGGGDGTGDDNDIWCHVHLKRSVGLGPTSPGEVWRAFLMRILLGGPERLSSALALVRRPEIGLVTAFDPYILGWTGSRRLLAALQARMDRGDGERWDGAPADGGPAGMDRAALDRAGMDRTLPDHPLLFPMGNMFWAKTGTVRAMKRLFGPDYPWPGEPLPGDGTVFHLIERLWPAAAALSGRDSVFLDKPDEPRV
ncbi:rhamnan synthesis F family protein [Acuticoccus sediminis]|uniref:rhamnan synthesis F family protein n=1 Tax=Acuticoccus sediminis TaxID=2184697 RepID=UPI001CFE0CD2|nr:rhamnan synthesis F family protein [Acuticoccus sediminis]